MNKNSSSNSYNSLQTIGRRICVFFQGDSETGKQRSRLSSKNGWSKYDIQIKRDSPLTLAGWQSHCAHRWSLPLLQHSKLPLFPLKGINHASTLTYYSSIAGVVLGCKDLLQSSDLLRLSALLGLILRINFPEVSFVPNLGPLSATPSASLITRPSNPQKTYMCILYTNTVAQVHKFIGICNE